jgi:hypothetical protein
MMIDPQACINACMDLDGRMRSVVVVAVSLSLSLSFFVYFRYFISFSQLMSLANQTLHRLAY